VHDGRQAAGAAILIEGSYRRLRAEAAVFRRVGGLVSSPILLGSVGVYSKLRHQTFTSMGKIRTRWW
jgi:hypothetical protein